MVYRYMSQAFFFQTDTAWRKTSKQKHCFQAMIIPTIATNHPLGDNARNQVLTELKQMICQ